MSANFDAITMLKSSDHLDLIFNGTMFSFVKETNIKIYLTEILENSTLDT